MGDSFLETVPTPTEKFRGAYNALFRFPIRVEEVDEWEHQVLKPYGHYTATQAIRRLADNGAHPNGPSIPDVKREIRVIVPKRTEEPRAICNLCSGDSGWMHAGHITDSGGATSACCGMTAWCPVQPKRSGCEFCKLNQHSGKVCRVEVMPCVCPTGEMRYQHILAKSARLNVTKYQALRQQFAAAIRERILWESKKFGAKMVPVDTSAASAVSLAMIKKFGGAT